MKLQLKEVTRPVKGNIIPYALCSMLLACTLGAQTWGPDVRLTTAGFGADSPDVTVCTDNVHVVWKDERDGNWEIYYKHSTNNGQNWTPGMRLTNDEEWSSYPVVACYDQSIHVAWWDNRTGADEIFIKRSTDNGINWGPSAMLTTAGHGAYFPSIAMHQENVHVVWEDIRDGNCEIYYKHSTNNGQNWTPGMRLTNDVAYSGNPSVAVSDSNVHVVWIDERDGNYEIYYKRSLDNGVTWRPDIRFTYSGVSAENASIATFQDNVHVVWEDFRDVNWELYYKHSTNNGQNWTPGMRLTNDVAYSGNPSVAVSDSNVHVVWQDDRDGTYEIYYKRSSDNGNTWSSDTRLTNNTAFSKHPKVSCTENDIHVVWEDLRDGNYEIYYKHGTPPGAVEEQTFQDIEHACLSTSMSCEAVIITYHIPTHTKVNLTVYDLLGKQVKALVNTTKGPGSYTVQWNGCSDDGERLANGIYFCQMQAGAFRTTEKLFLLR